jgi:hypothetical protein
LDNCIKCGVELTAANWSNSRQLNNHRICRPCHNDYLLAWSDKKNGIVRVGKERFSRRGIPQTPEHAAKRAASAKATLAETPRQCLACGEWFIRTQAAQKYCSGKCWEASEVRDAKRLRRANSLSVSPIEYALLIEQFGSACNICGADKGNSCGYRLSGS